MKRKNTYLKKGPTCPYGHILGTCFLKKSMSCACMQDYISGTCVFINPLHCILCGLVYIILYWTNGPWAQTKGPFCFEIVIYEMSINLFTNILNPQLFRKGLVPSVIGQNNLKIRRSLFGPKSALFSKIGWPHRLQRQILHQNTSSNIREHHSPLLNQCTAFYIKCFCYIY